MASAYDQAVHRAVVCTMNRVFKGQAEVVYWGGDSCAVKAKHPNTDAREASLTLRWERGECFLSVEGDEGVENTRVWLADFEPEAPEGEEEWWEENPQPYVFSVADEAELNAVFMPIVKEAAVCRLREAYLIGTLWPRPLTREGRAALKVYLPTGGHLKLRVDFRTDELIVEGQHRLPCKETRAYWMRRLREIAPTYNVSDGRFKRLKKNVLSIPFGGYNQIVAGCEVVERLLQG